MEPAYSLVLTPDQHSLIGEIIEIMGQVDDTMVRTVSRLLAVDHPAAAKIMGSTKAADNSAIWAHVIRNRCNKPYVQPFVALAEREIKAMAEKRNDFIHAIFSGDYAVAGYITTSATRVKSGRRIPTSELEIVRDRAATLSCLIAHIDHCTMEDGDHGPSPWLERLESLLQAHQPSRQAQHQGKEQKPPPEPSQE